MGKKYFLIIIFVVAVGIFFSFNIVANRQAELNVGYDDPLENEDVHFASFQDESKKEAIYSTVAGILQRGHYSPVKVDDAFSQKVFKTYLKRMDYNKTLFTQNDVKEFSIYKNRIDNEIEKRSTEFYDLVQRRYTIQIAKAEDIFKKVIAEDFNFSGNAEVELDGDKIGYVENDAALEKRWRENLTYRVLSRFNDAKENQKENIKKGELKASKAESEASLKAKAVDGVKKSMEYYFRRLKKLTDTERFGAYINSITQAYDPHTSYFAPKQKQRFDEEMSGSFFGIGAVLQMEDGTCKINQVMAGSPCHKQGSLKVGDGILKVAQGEDEPVDVVGWDLEDIVNIIRGKKGTIVKLTVQHLDGSEELIPIKRDKVEIEATFAKSAIINSKNSKIGFITLPEFYADFNNFNGRRCSKDMKAEIEKLKSSGVDGIIVDLRNNGGGSLSDVIDIAGYFIEDGPVVQVKSQNARPQEMPDRDKSVLYNGPLAILINSNSASASEILAAAMQDYKRAIILGSTSFGKGTVQRIYDMDEFYQGSPNNKPLGSIKLTMQKFYRVSGGSTQLRGVTPDVVIPTTFELLDLGERKDENAMPWDQIISADYTPYNMDYSGLIAKSKARINSNEQFKLIKQNAQRVKKQSDNNRYSLNEQTYRQQIQEGKDFAKKFEAIEEGRKLLEVGNLASVTKKIGSDTVEQRKNLEWREAIQKDPYISEAVNVLNDWIGTLPRELSAR